MVGRVISSVSPHPFLDHLFVLWLADFAAKRDNIAERKDARDYLLIVNALRERARASIRTSGTPTTRASTAE